jgi:hypothetical protein
MNWKPDKRQLDLVADMGNARMPAASIALALGVTEAEFSAWTERLVATRSMDAYALMYPAQSAAAPWVSQRATGRIIAECAFEAQPDAPEEV